MTTDRAARMRELLAEFAAPAALDRDQLLGALSALGELQAELDAVKVRMSAAVSLRSVVVGEQNTVTRAGHAGVASLLAERWRVSLPAARQLCAVGEAVAPRISLVGERLPARFPAVAEAPGLRRSALACSELRRRRAPYAQKPLDSAWMRPRAIDAVVGHGLRSVRSQSVGSQAVAFHEQGPDAADVVPDPRTIAQRRSDAGAEVYRHFAGCGERDALGGPAVTMVVRVDLETLRHGTGTAQLDGVASPVSAGTARRLAADARVIPVVLGGASEVLDLGRSRRLFSRAQRLALAERDDGCAWPGCPHPPSYTEAHHIRWWEAHAGPTDLSNGVLLCSSHHHRVHDDAWDLAVRDAVPYFIPPAHIDPRRRPRAGGRFRLRRIA